ncbi:hypothetical protein AAC387_Pa05g1908 [Persea americana]
MADSPITSVKFLQFLTKGLCGDCMKTVSNRIRSLHPDSTRDEHAANFLKMCHNDSQSHENHESCGENSLGSLRDGDMAPEEELEEGEIRRSSRWSDSRVDVKVHKRPRAMLGDDEMEMEYSRLMDVRRKKNFVCLERIRGKTLNILEGLELHNGVFSSAEQRTIVDFVYSLQKMGKRGQLMERTYSEPTKWMRGKGRVTIQFGCCYNYATDKKGNPPGILRREVVDPIPHLLKVIIRRLVRWHVLPPSCVPDSCIINIYEEGDCIPPHIDNHDFVRPFCTVSFLSECDILFGSSLKIVGPGEFSGSSCISLPVGSVLVLKGNGADVAKHCVPSVPAKRISITFRKMDDKKRPLEFVPEVDLQGIQPLPTDFNKWKRYKVEDDRKGYTSERGRRSTGMV